MIFHLFIPAALAIIGLTLIIIGSISLRAHAVAVFLKYNITVYDNKLRTRASIERYAAIHEFLEHSPTYWAVLFSFKKLDRKNFYTTEQLNTYF